MKKTNPPKQTHPRKNRLKMQTWEHMHWKFASNASILGQKCVKIVSEAPVRGYPFKMGGPPPPYLPRDHTPPKRTTPGTPQKVRSQDNRHASNPVTPPQKAHTQATTRQPPRQNNSRRGSLLAWGAPRAGAGRNLADLKPRGVFEGPECRGRHVTLQPGGEVRV